MGRLEEIKKEIGRHQDEISKLREEENQLELGDLDLLGKYLESDLYDVTIHVDDTYLSSTGELILSGETLSFSSGEYKDDCYFSWQLYGQVTIPCFKGSKDFREYWKEISQGEWRERKKEALSRFTKNYTHDIR